MAVPPRRRPALGRARIRRLPMGAHHREQELGRPKPSFVHWIRLVPAPPEHPYLTSSLPDLALNDETTLVAIGDVSGKGLKAAMNVALIIGTLRTLAEFETEP